MPVNIQEKQKTNVICQKGKKRSELTVFQAEKERQQLWLGLVSDIMVFIVSVTGCSYVFEHEIRD
ncbi:hypothetical protein GCM10028791_28800 [Echinicola sediminis]